MFRPATGLPDGTPFAQERRERRVGHRNPTTKNRRGANRGGLAFAEGSSTNKTAAIAGGRSCTVWMHRMDAPFIVEEVLFRPWQAWQRPTLPSLET